MPLSPEGMVLGNLRLSPVCTSAPHQNLHAIKENHLSTDTKLLGPVDSPTQTTNHTLTEPSLIPALLPYPPEGILSITKPPKP